VRSLALVGLVVAVLVATALGSPWIHLALTTLTERPFTLGRVWNRVFEVLLVVGLIAGWRRLDLGSPADIGLRARGWVGRLGAGLAVGVASIGVALGLCWVLGALEPALRYPPGKTVGKAAAGLVAAVLVGVGEEALFRGVLLRRLVRDAGRVAGMALTTAIYAAVHVVGHVPKVRGPAGAWAGVERAAALLSPLADPRQVPELLGLAAFGLVLLAARLRTGSLWMSIGIHAAWVAVFRVGRLFFTIDRTPAWLVGPGWPPLVGGLAGGVAIAVAAWLVRRRT
jgi:uncharacterized protein